MRGVRVSGLTRRFAIAGRTVEALADVDLDVASGQLVAVVGHSGCGKTTLLRQIAGLDRPDAGTIVFIDAAGGPTPAGRIGMVFQDARLLPWKTVRGNLLLALKRLTGGDEARLRVDDALDVVGLNDFADAWPHQLSGGMAQRVALARALCRDPDVLLLDEPFGALDALTRGRLHDEFAAIRARRPLTTVLVTHDIAEAVRLADRVAVMAAGRIAGIFEVPVSHPRPPVTPQLTELAVAITSAVTGRDAAAPPAPP